MTRRATAAASRAVAAIPVSEADFQGQLIQLARLLGWRTAHFRAAWSGRGWRTPVQGDGVGFPDTVLVRRDRFIAAELKSAKGKLSDDQTVWLAALEAAGVETYVWRPADLEEVAEILR